MKKVFDRIFKIVTLCVLVCLLGVFCFLIISGIVNLIRKNTFKIDLPKTPSNYSSYDYSSDRVSEYRLTDIAYEIDGDNLTFKFKGKKTYDVDGKRGLHTVDIVWQLLDSDNNVVASDDVASPNIQVGQKFAVESRDYAFDIDFNENYKLIIKYSCEENDEDFSEKQYENLFLGKWSNEEYLLSFRYKDGKFFGGIMNNEIETIVFEKYVATEKKITLYLDDGSVEILKYSFDDGFLYLDNEKFKPFN